jgi:hypothetical protein
MAKETDSLLVLEALKVLLKQQKQNYRALARHLKISVPSVKRAMNSASTPLSRIEEIASFLGLSLFEVLELARRESVENFHFTKEQEEFLAAHPHYFAYFDEVIRNSPAEIEKKHGISRRSTLLYLKKLERLGLLELHPGDVVKHRVRGQIIWDDHGALGKTFSRAMVKNMAARAVEKIGDPGSIFLELSGWKLSLEEYKDFQRSYTELTKRYQALSSFNKRARNKNASVSVSAVMIADEWKDPFQLRVTEIGSVKL